MLRTMIAAAAALALAAPASAQTAQLLTSDAWECRMTSLVGDPPSNLIISFTEPNTFFASFYIEMTEGADVVSMEFDIAGDWTLANSMIAMTASDSELVGVWVNDEEIDAETMAEMEASLTDQMNDFTGESTVAYIAQHAMVLDETETSISCWR